MTKDRLEMGQMVRKRGGVERSNMGVEKLVKEKVAGVMGIGAVWGRRTLIL